MVGLGRDIGTFEACVVFDFPQHRRVGSKIEVAHADVVAAHFLKRFPCESSRIIAALRAESVASMSLFVSEHDSSMWLSSWSAFMAVPS